MGKMTYYLKCFCLLIIIFHQTYSISDERACADEECKEILSYAKTLVRYPSGHRYVLSFAKNEDVIVYSKSAGSDRRYWGVEINGKRGYAPKEFLKETKKFAKATVVVPTEFFEFVNGVLVPKRKKVKDGADVVINKNIVVEDINLRQTERTETLPSLESSIKLPIISGASAELLNSPSGDIKVTQPYNVVDGTTIFSDPVVPSSLNENDHDESSTMEFDLNDDDGFVEEVDYSGSGRGDEEISGDIPAEENMLDDHMTGSGGNSNEPKILDQDKVKPSPAETEIKLNKSTDNDNASVFVTKELGVLENIVNSLDLKNSKNNSIFVSERQDDNEKVDEQVDIITKTIHDSDFKGGITPQQKSDTNTESRESEDDIIPHLNVGETINDIIPPLNAGETINDRIAPLNAADTINDIIPPLNAETIDLSQNNELKLGFYDNSIQNITISEDLLPSSDLNTEPSISLNSSNSDANLSLANSLPTSNNDSMPLDVNNIENNGSFHEINHHNANNFESIQERGDIMHDEKLSDISQQKIIDAVPLSQDIPNNINNDVDNLENNKKETVDRYPVNYDMNIESVYLKPQSSNSSPNLDPLPQNNEEDLTKFLISQNDTQTETDILNNTNILDTEYIDQVQKESFPVTPENILVPTERPIDTTPVNIYQHEDPIIPTDDLLETSTQSSQIKETLTQHAGISSTDLPIGSNLEFPKEERVKIQHLPYPDNYFPNAATLNVKSNTQELVDSLHEFKENTFKLKDDQLIHNEDRIEDIPDKIIQHPGYNIPNIKSNTEELVESTQEYKENASELKNGIYAQSEVKILEEVDKNMFINDQVSTEPISAEAQTVSETYVSNTLKIFESLFDRVFSVFKASSSVPYEHLLPEKILEEDAKNVESGEPGQSQDFISSILSAPPPQQCLAEDRMVGWTDVSIELIFWLVISAISVLIFTLGYYYLENRKQDGKLLSMVNSLQKELLCSSKECIILREELTVTKEKLSGIEDSSFGSNEMVACLKKEIFDAQQSIADLHDKLTSAEEELANSTEAALELQSILDEQLSAKDTSSSSLAFTVANLQSQLDDQQTTMNQTKAQLNSKVEENDLLLLKIAEIGNKNASMGKELADCQNQLRQARDECESKSSQLQDLTSNMEKSLQQVKEQRTADIKELQIQIKSQKEDMEATKVALKARAHEVTSLQENLKLLKLDDKNLKAILDTSHTKAELTQAVSEKIILVEKLEKEQTLLLELSNKVDEQDAKMAQMKDQLNEAEHKAIQATSRLEVLTNYFNQKEADLLKELSTKEAVWLSQQGEAMSTVEKIQSLQQEIQQYKETAEGVRRELAEQEVVWRARGAALERRAHEQWLARRAAERAAEASATEAQTLRRRLAAPSPTDKRVVSPLNAGDGIPELPMLPMPPPPLPFLPPPLPPPFMHPPPLPPHRPPPLGRLSSPPLPPQHMRHERYSPDSRYSPDRDYSPDRRSTPQNRVRSPFSPQEARRRGYPSRRYDDDERYYDSGEDRRPGRYEETETDLSPPPSPPPPRRIAPRNHKGVSSGSGQSSESLERISKHSGKY